MHLELSEGVFLLIDNSSHEDNPKTTVQSSLPSAPVTLCGDHAYEQLTLKGMLENLVHILLVILVGLDNYQSQLQLLLL